MLSNEFGVLTFLVFLVAVAQVGDGGGAADGEGFCEAGVEGCEVRE